MRPAADLPGRTTATRAVRRGPSASSASAYDFKRPIQLSREHSRALQLTFDAFARQATTLFTSTLRTVCQVSMVSIDQRSYAEYVDALDPLTYLAVFTADPLPGSCVLQLPMPAAMTCVDHMLGGPGAAEQPQRPLTEIEAGVVRGLVVRLLGLLRESLAETVAVEPVVTGVEHSPQFAQVAGAADVMVVVSLDLLLDERLHRWSLCLPFNGLLPHLVTAAAPAPLGDRERAQRGRSAQLLADHFAAIPVEVSVRFRSSRIPSAVLAGLRPGEVLRLDHPAAAPLEVATDDTLFAHATPGAKGPHLAALIVGVSQEAR